MIDQISTRVANGVYIQDILLNTFDKTIR